MADDLKYDANGTWQYAIDPSTLVFHNNPPPPAAGKLPSPVYDAGLPPLAITALACIFVHAYMIGEYAPKMNFNLNSVFLGDAVPGADQKDVFSSKLTHAPRVSTSRTKRGLGMPISQHPSSNSPSNLSSPSSVHL
jgi:hypothetical protein